MDKLERLKRIVDNNYAERERESTRLMKRDENYNLIKSSPNLKLTEFFCSKHQLDFTTLAYKQVSGDKAVYKADCPKCSCEPNYSFTKRCERYITDRFKDPYYNESLLIRKQRFDARDDLLQPGDPRFNLLYGGNRNKIIQ